MVRKLDFLVVLFSSRGCFPFLLLLLLLLRGGVLPSFGLWCGPSFLFLRVASRLLSHVWFSMSSSALRLFGSCGGGVLDHLLVLPLSTLVDSDSTSAPPQLLVL